MRKNILDRLVWAEINLKNLDKNIANIKKKIGKDVKIMPVLKANAYGHGLVRIAKRLEKTGVSYLGVACMNEAESLRTAKIKLPILILGYTDFLSVKKAVEKEITLTIIDEKVLKALDGEAKKQNKIAKIHVKVDTGMHRFGLLPNEAISFMKVVSRFHNIKVEGVFTHFATADEKDLSFAYEQLGVFNKFIKKLDSLGLKPALVHAANSAATLRMPEAYFDMVRPGIIVYGNSPSSDFKLPFRLYPILNLKTLIIQIKQISKNEPVGYGRGFIAVKDTMIATIPVGYADGFRRSPNFGGVLIKGKMAKILGNVSMDQSTIDINMIKNVKVGDEAVLIGKQKDKNISVADIANKLGTINYEVLTSISARVARVYIN